MSSTLDVKPIGGVWICIGRSLFGIGNTTTEAYNDYEQSSLEFNNGDLVALPIEKCRFYYSASYTSFQG